MNQILIDITCLMELDGCVTCDFGFAGIDFYVIPVVEAQPVHPVLNIPIAGE